jgi:hypothetical protein
MSNISIDILDNNTIEIKYNKSVLCQYENPLCEWLKSVYGMAKWLDVEIPCKSKEEESDGNEYCTITININRQT